MRWMLLLTLSVAVLAPSARADVLELPAARDAAPLLVVLHGDRDTAKTTAARWRAATKERGWALRALDCRRTSWSATRIRCTVSRRICARGSTAAGRTWCGI